LLGLRGTKAWLYHVLHEGSVGYDRWQETGLIIRTDQAYSSYEEFSKQRREWQPEIKAVWSKNIHAVLGPNVEDTRPTIGTERVRSFQFTPLSDCRRQFATHLSAPDLEWGEPENGSEKRPETAETEPEDDDWEPVDDPEDDEWEPVDEPQPENEPDNRPEDEREQASA